MLCIKSYNLGFEFVNQILNGEASRCSGVDVGSTEFATVPQDRRRRNKCPPYLLITLPLIVLSRAR